MSVLKCLLFIGFITASVHCNNTITTTTSILKHENVNHTNKMGVVALSNAASNTTITIPTEVLSVNPLNDSKIVRIGMHYIPTEKRKTVLIINSPSILRQSSKKRKRGSKKRADPSMAKVESLLYEEYDADGTKLVEFMMYTMEDVSKFFAAFLHTEICHVRCEPRPEDIARDEAKKKESSTSKP